MNDSKTSWKLNPELREMADVGERSTVAEILRGFLDDAEDQIQRAEEAMQSEDCERLNFAAHSLTGSAAMVGLDDFSQVARQLQMLAKAHRIAESYEQLQSLREKLPSAKEAIGRTISELINSQ
jgi:HPt (histidine-containing phosphotransfer) domain-containing protein